MGLVLVDGRSVLNLTAFERDEAGGGGAEARDHDDREFHLVVPSVEERGFTHLARSAVGANPEDSAAGWNVFPVAENDVLEAGTCGNVDAGFGGWCCCFHRPSSASLTT